MRSAERLPMHHSFHTFQQLTPHTQRRRFGGAIAPELPDISLQRSKDKQDCEMRSAA
jgi:hypothetical protein